MIEPYLQNIKLVQSRRTWKRTWPGWYGKSQGRRLARNRFFWIRLGDQNQALITVWSYLTPLIAGQAIRGCNSNSTVRALVYGNWPANEAVFFRVLGRRNERPPASCSGGLRGIILQYDGQWSLTVNGRKTVLGKYIHILPPPEPMGGRTQLPTVPTYKRSL